MGSRPYILLILHNSLIQSTLDYVSTIYSSANPKTLKIHNTVQNANIKMSIGAFRSSPMDSLLSKAKCPPLDIKRKFLITKYAAKKMSTSQTNMIEIVLNPL